MPSMMRSFRDPFSMSPYALEGPRRNMRDRERQDLVPHAGFMNDMMGPMSLFSNMDSMFSNMQRQMVRNESS